MKIPFLDLKNQITQIPEVHQNIDLLLESCAFVGGPSVNEFENKFAQFVKSKFCIGVGNGTDALEIALQSLNLPPKSEVIVPANTFVASSEAIVNTGLIPRFVDCNPEHLNLDPKNVEQAINPNTSAILVVHLYGQAAPMRELTHICKSHDLQMIEDCAQAHGALYNHQPVGSFGNIAAYSFYPGKNLGAFGDAGAITTNDEALAESCRMISTHGAAQKYMHEIDGRNSRLDTIQAIVLSAKLDKLPRWNQIRQQTAEQYRQLLSRIPQIQLTQELYESTGVYHLMAVRHPERDLIRQKLEKYNIQSGIHYPHALNQLPHYRSRFKNDTCPNAEYSAKTVFSLPMGEHMTPQMVEYVCEKLQLILNTEL